MASHQDQTHVNQPTLAPTTKVTAGAIAGAITVVLVWLVGMAGLEVPAEVASAVTVIISFLTSYIKHDRVQLPEG